MTDRDAECELGYWIDKPFRGRRLNPEASQELLRPACEELGMRPVWCGCYDGNLRRRRVQENRDPFIVTPPRDRRSRQLTEQEQDTLCF